MMLHSHLREGGGRGVGGKGKGRKGEGGGR